MWLLLYLQLLHCLTPPDPITQIGLAIPLLILYELSIFSVNLIEKRIKEKEKEHA